MRFSARFRCWWDRGAGGGVWLADRLLLRSSRLTSTWCFVGYQAAFVRLGPLLIWVAKERHSAKLKAPEHRSPCGMSLPPVQLASAEAGVAPNAARVWPLLAGIDRRRARVFNPRPAA